MEQSRAYVRAYLDGLLDRADCKREREAECRDEPRELAAVMESLRHHRVREHGQDSAPPANASTMATVRADAVSSTT